MKYNNIHYILSTHTRKIIIRTFLTLFQFRHSPNRSILLFLLRFEELIYYYETAEGEFLLKEIFIKNN